MTSMANKARVSVMRAQAGTRCMNIPDGCWSQKGLTLEQHSGALDVASEMPPSALKQRDLSLS
jgi:hypothetical protein